MCQNIQKALTPSKKCTNKYTKNILKWSPQWIQNPPKIDSGGPPGGGPEKETKKVAKLPPSGPPKYGFRIGGV